MSDNRTFIVTALSEAIGPITQMRGVSGNESLINRECVLTPRGVVEVPVLSGNALRHRSCREPGARWLIDQYWLKGQLTLQLLNFLFHGGNLTEGGGRDNTAIIVELQRLFPLMRLIGGSLPSQILAGSLDVRRGMLICEENRVGIAASVPAEWTLPEKSLHSAERFVSGWQYTRSDAAIGQVDLTTPRADPSLPPALEGPQETALMIFSGQHVIRGSLFLHGYVLKHVSALELGALLWSLTLWQRAGGTIGGQAAKGHGRLDTSIHVRDDDGEVSHERMVESVTAYQRHALAVKDEAIAWLHQVFTPKPLKEPKAKATKEAKGKKVKTRPEDELSTVHAFGLLPDEMEGFGE